MQTRIDKFGRILIPRSIRRHFNLEPGDDLQLQQEEERIVIKPISSKEVLALKSGVLVFKGRVTGELSDALQQDRDIRIKSLSSSSRS